MALNEELLIETVRMYPILYDLSHKHYHDVTQRENAWMEISSTLKHSVFECKRKWNSLRDSFRKALRKRKSKGGQQTKVTKLWKYEENMAFVSPFLTEREQSSSLSQAFCEDIKCEVQMGEQDEAENSSSSLGNVASPDTPHSSSTIPTPPPPGPLSRRNHQHVPSIECVLKNYFDEKQKAQVKSDPLKKFFEAMEETVRTFHPYLQIEIKSKISSLVSEYELRNLMEQQPTAQQNQQFIT